nr:MAG TPA: hypothetical protein [Caudoviricetes sp.]DAV18379.1 MAG TPA: hypothetical protein [Caudoviricetes sp.]
MRCYLRKKQKKSPRLLKRQSERLEKQWRSGDALLHKELFRLCSKPSSTDNQFSGRSIENFPKFLNLRFGMTCILQRANELSFEKFIIHGFHLLSF